jgi:hypothetical protein
MGNQNEINSTLSKGTLSLTTVSRMIVSIMILNIMTHSIMALSIMKLIGGVFHKTLTIVPYLNNINLKRPHHFINKSPHSKFLS